MKEPNCLNPDNADSANLTQSFVFSALNLDISEVLFSCILALLIIATLISYRKQSMKDYL